MNELERTKLIGSVREMRRARDNHLIDESDFNDALIRLFIKAKIEEVEPFTDKRITMVQTLFRFADKRLSELKSQLELLK